MIPRFSRRRALTAAGFVVAAIAAWLLTVDFSWFIEHCPDCYGQRDSLEWRVLGYPIRRIARTDPNLIEQVAADLGVPCSHANLQRRHKQRWWGLCICTCPCQNGIDGLTGDAKWYDPRLSASVKELAVSEPGLPQEFRQRVLVDHDDGYWLAFRERLHSLKANRE